MGETGLDSFDYSTRQAWMSKNWTYSFHIIVVYLVSIFLGQLWMRNRAPYNLRTTLTLWNLALAIFSVLATLKTLPELISILSYERGFHHSVCSPCADVTPASAFWAWAFVLSKVVELGTTLLLVFLWGLHSSSSLVCLSNLITITNRNQYLPHHYHSFFGFDSMSLINFILDLLGSWSLISLYMSQKVRIPKPVSIGITALQLSQMVVGVGVNSYAYYVKSQSAPCDISYINLKMGFFMYSTYFILFLHFFYRAYFTGGKKSKSKSE